MKEYTLKITKPQADTMRKALKAAYKFKLGDSFYMIRELEVAEYPGSRLKPEMLDESFLRKTADAVDALLASRLGLDQGSFFDAGLFEDSAIMKKLFETDFPGGKEALKGVQVDFEIWKLTEKEIQVLNVAIEGYARFKIGQVDVLVDLLQRKDGSWAGGWDFSEKISEIIKPAINLVSGGSYGIGKFDDADELYMIHMAIRHHLAWERARKEGKTNPDGSRNWSNMLGVSYDEPMKLGSGIVPKICTLENTASS